MATGCEGADPALARRAVSGYNELTVTSLRAGGAGASSRRVTPALTADPIMNRRDRFDGEFDTVLALARTGAPWAFERIFTALSPVVEGYLRVQGAAEPEDLTSEVFLAVLRNLGTFQGDEAGFRSWVFTIAHRRLLDARRRAMRRPRSAPLDEVPDAPTLEDVEQIVDRRLATEQVRALCERLKPEQRDVLLLRLLGRLTVDEVAAALDKSPGAVKALQRRGLQSISRLMEREGASL